MLGLEKARDLATSHTENALGLIEKIGGENEFC